MLNKFLIIVVFENSNFFGVFVLKLISIRKKIDIFEFLKSKKISIYCTVDLNFNLLKN